MTLRLQKLYGITKHLEKPPDFINKNIDSMALKIIFTNLNKKRTIKIKQTANTDSFINKYFQFLIPTMLKN